MQFRLSLFDLLVLVAIVAGITAYWWSDREVTRLEHQNRQMRERAGELTVSNKHDLHAISKPRYGNVGNEVFWDVFVPNGQFQICFVQNNKAGKRPKTPVETYFSFPLLSGIHELVIKLKSNGEQVSVDEKSNTGCRLEFWEDGELIGLIDGIMPENGMNFGYHNPVPRQLDLDADSPLVLETFHEISPNGPFVLRSWSIWIERSK